MSKKVYALLEAKIVDEDLTKSEVHCAIYANREDAEKRMRINFNDTRGYDYDYALSEDDYSLNNAGAFIWYEDIVYYWEIREITTEDALDKVYAVVNYDTEGYGLHHPDLNIRAFETLEDAQKELRTEFQKAHEDASEGYIDTDKAKTWCGDTSATITYKEDTEENDYEETYQNWRIEKLTIKTAA